MLHRTRRHCALAGNPVPCLRRHRRRRRLGPNAARLSPRPVHRCHGAGTRSRHTSARHRPHRRRPPRPDPRPGPGRGRRRTARAGAGRLRPRLPAAAARRTARGHELTFRQAAEDDALLALSLQPQPGRTVTVTRTPSGWIAHEETAGQRRHLVLARGTSGRTCWRISAPPACPIRLARELVQVWRMRSISSASSAPGTVSRYCLNASATARATCCGTAGCCMPDFAWPAATSRSGARTPDSGPTGSTTRAAACAAPSSAPRSTAPASPPASACGRIRCSATPACIRGSTSPRPSGTPVFAAADGEVVQIGWLGGYGRVVTLQHPEDRSTRYAHLSGLRAGA